MKELETVKFLLTEFENELTRTTKGWNGKTYQGTRRARLKRLRIEINNILTDVERNYPINTYKEITEND